MKLLPPTFKSGERMYRSDSLCRLIAERCGWRQFPYINNTIPAQSAYSEVEFFVFWRRDP